MGNEHQTSGERSGDASKMERAGVSRSHGVYQLGHWPPFQWSRASELQGHLPRMSAWSGSEGSECELRFTAWREALLVFLLGSEIVEHEEKGDLTDES